jgi:uncharacterized protein (TIGR02391 family)
MVADHENANPRGFFEAQRVSDLLGLPIQEVHKQFDILVHQGFLDDSARSLTGYAVKMKPPGWELLEQVVVEPAANSMPRPVHSYGFHAEIEKVSGQLYRDGHFREAALNGYIRVIDEVRVRSGLALDGDNLMNRAFGCDRQTPVIQVNSLSSQAEIDEQKGFMNLFKGIVGLRNLKAHTVVLFNDPHRAHEYLALASLLMRILEISQVSRSSQP